MIQHAVPMNIAEAIASKDAIAFRLTRIRFLLKRQAAENEKPGANSLDRMAHEIAHLEAVEARLEATIANHYAQVVFMLRESYAGR